MNVCEESLVPVVHPAILRRRSPVQFDREARVSDAAVDTILDAARLAPSAGNSQPWSFIVGRRHDLVHARIVQHLAVSSSRWAPDASVIVVNLREFWLKRPNGSTRNFRVMTWGRPLRI